MRKIFIGLLILSFTGLAYASGIQTLLDKLPKTDLYGHSIKYNKKAYLVDVWATWCPPCRMTVPVLIKLQKMYPSKDFMVIGLSVDSSGPEDVKKFVTEEKMNYPVAMAGNTLNDLPPVRGIPTMFLLDKKGKIIAQFIGYTSQDILGNAVNKALHNKTI